MVFLTDDRKTSGNPKNKEAFTFSKAMHDAHGSHAPVPVVQPVPFDHISTRTFTANVAAVATLPPLARYRCSS